MNADRSEEILAALGSAYRGARIRPIAGDASSRSFFRLFLPGGRTAVVMDYGAPFERDTDDVLMSRIFLDAGLPVAEILDRFPREGWLVMEDLGDRTLEAEISSLDLPRELDSAERNFRNAVSLAAAVANRGTVSLRRSDRAAGPALDESRFRFEMDFFLDHYVRGLCGRDWVPDALTSALHQLATGAAASPRVLCHRDFHSRNLLVQRDGSLAMVDIQDARWGPDTYDLASLLRDAYLDVDDNLGDVLLEDYRRRLDVPHAPATFRRRFEVVSIQRMIKALGTFGFQIHSRGQNRYADAIPRTLDRLTRCLPASPLTSSLGEILTRADLLKPPPGLLRNTTPD